MRSVWVCLFKNCIVATQNTQTHTSTQDQGLKIRNWHHVGRLHRFVNIGFFRIRRVCVLVVWFIVEFIVWLIIIIIILVVFYFEYETLPLRASRQRLVPWD
jgi:hypothetical protein